ncbi:3-hydroxyisobutyrate dehydrogenase [Ameyamaea chiangmaiensis NBRC 103196]|uniref:NAD(P)-dependent oxidoreductase n=2 Tax=Ameyamaea chiangmaiensis TaxID=442969 RepID=A0A850PF07_9PROT|nr:NAD(P)-dependent oxidoreductase [Ameyamaea chiangmaiensis]MBS4074402.1 NAD(P)-dependent oxidoreductase [Ameyamaea chiangmaiensis]NVN40492.1 NAD(P)-dependent oxidoreductase [Ameyamaea chiangmaiensis]GBQ71909.1 3-hydroxyisobutyrate dehydrogenase [Ameyamaea chiangmaiensis NBRC 103196]
MTLGKIGFIGFGAMASRMGENLRRAGAEIAAYTPSGKGGDGALRFLATARDIAAWSDTVIVCVPDDAALATATQGPDGLIAGLSADTLVINTSSVSPEAAVALHDAASARGTCAVDAPVSGSTPEAEAGQLVVLAGGETDALERAAPVFAVIGKATIHAGPAGSGAKLKLVVNGIMGTGLSALAECVAYGLASGLNRSTLFDALDQVAVLSPHHKRKLKAAKVGDFAPQFPTRLMLKDMGLLLRGAEGVRVPVPTVAASTQMLALSARRHEQDDYAALIGVMEHLVANAP